jgi:hypothetical protein
MTPIIAKYKSIKGEAGMICRSFCLLNSFADKLKPFVGDIVAAIKKKHEENVKAVSENPLDQAKEMLSSGIDQSKVMQD